MSHRRLPMLALAAVAGLGLATAADAGQGKSKRAPKQVKFAGVHPIPKNAGGGVCHIEAPHVHVFTPADVEVQYRVHDDHYVFVGDPVAYGWEGDKHAYVGHHPVHVDVVIGEDDGDHDHVEYCYLDGAHYHHYAPPPGVRFEARAGAYWYVGELPEIYVEARPRYDKIDVVYEPLVYERPAVVVEAAPPGWVGLSIAVAAPVVEVEAPRAKVRERVHADVEVVTPGVVVEVDVPSVVIEGHVGGFVVGGHGHYKVKGKHKRGKWKGKGKGRGKHKARVRDHRW